MLYAPLPIILVLLLHLRTHHNSLRVRSDLHQVVDEFNESSLVLNIFLKCFETRLLLELL
jgi:hypothetical protein